MLCEPITIQNAMGLHTRAAAKLVALASQFKSQIQLAQRDQLADCKSIMALILLGAKKGTTLDLIISGNDEREALKAIFELFDRKFDES